MTALLVDDNPDYVYMLARKLEKRFSVKTTSVFSGKLAIEALRTNKFDVMICDYEMPGMNGFDVFKQMTDENLTCPFLLYTNADLTTLPKFEGPGFLGIVKKPEVEKLFTHLSLLLGQPT